MKTLWTGVCPCSIFREREYHFRIITRRERGAAIVLSHGEDIFKTFSKCGRLGALQLPRPQATERESNRREVGVKGLAGDPQCWPPSCGTGERQCRGWRGIYTRGQQCSSLSCLPGQACGSPSEQENEAPTLIL